MENYNSTNILNNVKSSWKNFFIDNIELLDTILNKVEKYRIKYEGEYDIFPFYWNL